MSMDCGGRQSCRWNGLSMRPTAGSRDSVKQTDGKSCNGQ